MTNQKSYYGLELYTTPGGSIIEIVYKFDNKYARNNWVNENRNRRIVSARDPAVVKANKYRSTKFVANYLASSL